MASYQGDDFGAFLPGLTRIIAQPFKTTLKIAKTFVKSPIKGVGAAFMAPVDVVKAWKFAAMGSKPIFKKKAPPKAAQGPKNGSSIAQAAQQAIDAAAQMPIVPTNYIQQQQPTSEVQPSVGPPGMEIPPSTGEQKKSPVLLIAGLGVAAVGAYFLLKKKG